MKYNPAIHRRRSIRLKGYDYSKKGIYFITVCCQDMICRFGQIKNGKMILNDVGKIGTWVQIIHYQTIGFFCVAAQLLGKHHPK